MVISAANIPLNMIYFQLGTALKSLLGGRGGGGWDTCLSGRGCSILTKIWRGAQILPNPKECYFFLQNISEKLFFLNNMLYTL